MGNVNMNWALGRMILGLILGCGNSSIVVATQSGSKKLVSSFGAKSQETTATPHQLQGADIFKMNQQRHKKLEKVKTLLEDPKAQNSILEKKLTHLMKVYRQQYSAFAAKIDHRTMGAGQTSNNGLPVNLTPRSHRKYRTIMQEMKRVLEEMNQQDAPFVEIYQKAVYCHGLFSHLEALLDEQSLLKTWEQSGLSDEGAVGRRQAQEMGGMGDLDHKTRRRGSSVFEEDLGMSGPVIIVPAFLGKQHGVDRLIDNNDDNR